MMHENGNILSLNFGGGVQPSFAVNINMFG